MGADVPAMLQAGKSMAIYHTAGKGTRLAPLPGAENNNKPGVKLPALLKVDGEVRLRGTPSTFHDLRPRPPPTVPPPRGGASHLQRHSTVTRTRTAALLL